MKKEPLIIIKLMLKNFTNQLSQELARATYELLSKKYENIGIELLSTENYWKIPELKICYIGIFYKSPITVYEVARCLTTSDFLHTKEKKEEEVIWDQKTHSGVFVTQHVEWAHIYTWK